MEDLISLSIIAIACFLTVVLGMLIHKITDICDKRKEKKFNEKHPKYIEFKKTFNKLQNELSEIWKSTMPDYRRAIDYLIEEMKYYPEHSDKYKECENRLNIAREKINTCQEEYDKKEKEIRLFVQANKDAIEELKDDDFNSYVGWVQRYDL